MRLYLQRAGCSLVLAGSNLVYTKVRGESWPPQSKCHRSSKPTLLDRGVLSDPKYLHFNAPPLHTHSTRQLGRQPTCSCHIARPPQTNAPRFVCAPKTRANNNTMSELASALNDPSVAVELVCGPPVAELVAQAPGSGIVVSGQFCAQPRR